MEPEQTSEIEEVEEKSNFNKVTPLSKYLAMALFIAMPFIGGWVGYTYAPEKIVEVEKVVVVEKEPETEIIESNSNQEIVLVPLPYNELSTTTTYEYGLFGQRYFWDWTDESRTSQILRVIVQGNMAHEYYIQSFEGVDLDTFEDLGNDFARDKNYVYYFGEYPFIESGIIEGADPETFKIKNLSDIRRVFFSVDKDSFYFLSRKLDGIDPETVSMTEKGIIKDKDTYWFPSGSCHHANYRLGTEEEIEDFIPPC